MDLSGYDVNHFFCAFSCEYLLHILLFLLGKKLVTLDIYTKKMNPPSDVFLGGGCRARPAGSEPKVIDLLFESTFLCSLSQRVTNSLLWLIKHLRTHFISKVVILK